jgi:NitT/TauT family transport system permease protein
LRHLVQKMVMPAAPAVVFIALWQGLVLRSPELDFVVGSPYGIVREYQYLVQQGHFWRDVGVTALEAVLGFIAGSVFGTGVGLAMSVSETAFRIARPYLVALGAIPVFALGPVLIFWFGTGIWSKAVLAFLSTFVIAVAQAHIGAIEADPNLVRLTRSIGGTRRQLFLKILIPSATIWVLSGIRMNIGMSLLGAFVGEFISSRMGLGHLIILAEGLYNVNQIWVGVIGIMGIAVTFHIFTLPIERWARRWKATRLQE